VLRAYADEINKHGGALLSCVVSGKLREGINFSDELGRGVAVFGLPFPNSHSVEWKTKMEYIASKAEAASLQSGMQIPQAIASGKAAASEFYENATMRSVNQAVGRAIRHKDDYAAILLVDRRYNTERIQKKLPGWMKDSLKGAAPLNQITSGLRQFFADKA